MSTARHHAEWLSLVEANGPFISLKVLMDVFPQGLDSHEPEYFRRLKSAYEEWQASQNSQNSSNQSVALHRTWVKFVLKEALGYLDDVLLEGQKIPTSLKADFPEHSETLQPDWVLVNHSQSEKDPNKPRLLIQIVPSSQGLEKRVSGSRWSASPATRMMELLHACNIRLGLITNGQQWMLVNAPRGETTGFISWYSNIWLEDNITLRAFRSLLCLERFLSAKENETIEALLARSVDDQQEVTDQLGYQVRKAVEVLVQKFDRIDKDKLFSLKDVGEKRLYEAALTVMMRLVFMFCAEEKDLFPANDELYSNYYAVSTLRSQLSEVAHQHGEEVLERRSDAWARLLAIFRVVHSGLQHDLFSLPAYGGSLFDPDRFPFLEGREIGSKWKDTQAKPIHIDNRTVLHLLEALQILKVKLPGGGSEPRRLSFRALDVEQIGHVYEGLLDHTTVRASSPVLGLEGTKNKEPEVLLEKLEQMKVKSEDALLEFLHNETGRGIPALKKALAIEISAQDIDRFKVSCENDLSLLERVRPFAGLIRKDTLDYPIVINTTSVYVTQGEDRRSTGTHYTPRSLTEPIVKYTLEPICYIGVAEGKPKEEWQLKPASELLMLKVCDFAMGSGAFLVQACRYLAERLVEAWEESEREHPGKVIVTPEGELSEHRPDESIIPKDPSERMIVAKRIVADRCLYGVDKNPMAVEMAKLSLWLETMQQSRPFTFLDHALKCGDSLLGVTDPEQIKYFKLQPEKLGQHPLVPIYCEPLLQKAIAKRQELEGFTINDINDVKRKEQLFLEAEKALDEVRFLGDLLIGEALRRISKSSDYVVDELSVLSDEVKDALDFNNQYQSIRLKSLQDKAKRLLGNCKPFHWLLEFPEIFWQGNGNRGFDAIISNPPFLGGRNITFQLGKSYNDCISSLYESPGTSADLCSYFFRRAWILNGAYGEFACVATESIASGPTEENGLRFIVNSGGNIKRANTNVPWPGDPNRRVAVVHICKRLYKQAFLNGIRVRKITSSLEASSDFDNLPYQLKSNENKAFQGITVFGEAFIVSQLEHEKLCKTNPSCSKVLTPYLTGEDLNRLPLPKASSYVINFNNLSEEEASDKYPACFLRLEESVKLRRQSVTSRKDVKQNWWRLQRVAPELEEAARPYKNIICRTRYGSFHALTFVAKEGLFSDGVLAFVFDSSADFAILHSSLHFSWAEKYGSVRAGQLRYGIKTCFNTFPFAKKSDQLYSIGETYFIHRQKLLELSNEGLTKTYNQFHNPNETSAGIAQLRQLHREMDEVVAAAYGWTDLDLGHGFHQTKQGMRYTICEEARREVLDRLLQLNHQRYAEEVAAGLHDTGKGKKKATNTSTKGKKVKVEETEEIQGNLF